MVGCLLPIQLEIQYFYVTKLWFRGWGGCLEVVFLASCQGGRLGALVEFGWCLLRVEFSLVW